MNLPYISKTNGIGGKIREKPEFFRVIEIPAYSPSGEGNHLFVEITKKGVSTPEMLDKVSRILEIPIFDLGCAGLKDKHALTTQTISIFIQDNSSDNVDRIISKLRNELEIGAFKLHQNKLKPGHLAGNKFIITISQVSENSEENAQKIAEELKISGVPNFYGAQRFGANMDNAEKAKKILSGELRVREKWLKRFLLSSYQSHLFNQYLTKRVLRGFNNLMQGDICKKHDTGGLFVVENLEEEQKRYNKKEISFTGPMFGKKLWFAESESGEFERQVLTESGLSEEKVSMLGAGLRRPGRIILGDICARKVTEGIEVSFSLPKGSFATVVLREFMKTD
jgi:tRNA pseudouridine13 synthase